MSNIDKNELLEFIISNKPKAVVKYMRPSDLIFEEQVKMNCFSCGRDARNWRCPPNLPNIDYKKMFSEFNDGAFVCLSYSVDDVLSYSEIRNDSSIELHKLLLKVEQWLWNHNEPTALSFGGGSCKLCKGGCGEYRCNNPYMSRSPLEATGVNVIKSAKKYGIDIAFSTDKLKRIGLIVWNNDQ